VVTHGQGLRWIECTVTGKESHTGSTPMAMRRNAGRGLAQLTELVHEIAMAHQPNAVGAIGHIDVYPNSRNIIPGRVVFTVDFRSHVLGDAARDGGGVRGAGAGDLRGAGVRVRQRGGRAVRPAGLRRGLCRRGAAGGGAAGYSHRDIVSGRGARRVLDQPGGADGDGDVPLRRRASHNEAEEITPEWAEKGANVLFHAVVETAEIVE
jgi:beta-ureidopropionase / N-carbamoyl-L-amino-acid hydrolase